MKLQHFIKEEGQGIKDYEKAEKTDPKDKKVYKQILSQEKKHLKLLKKAKVVNKVLDKAKK